MGEVSIGFKNEPASLALQQSAFQPLRYRSERSSRLPAHLRPQLSCRQEHHRREPAEPLAIVG